jgi:hypothetical protein
MIGILIFDNTTRYIFLFYFLILSSNACTYLSLMHVLRHYEVPEGAGLRERVKIYYYIMNVLYVLMIPVAFVPGIAPVCTNFDTYPTALYWCNILFLTNAVFFWVLYKKNFFFPLSSTDSDSEKSPLI